ncbi:protein-tyrosine phosphatase-like protein, partial [Baffinella frigidus]
VSKNKRRFEEGGFNLDLSYITPRVVAMGYPSDGVEGQYRNEISEVYRFFETHHPDAYMIYNLCSERSYDPSKFHGRVECYPFDDHNPPPFEMMRPLCQRVFEWLQKEPDHMVALHCKAGKGRTGVMVVAILMHLGMFTDAEEALRYYGEKRTRDGEGVTIHSQRRY